MYDGIVIGVHSTDKPAPSDRQEFTHKRLASQLGDVGMIWFALFICPEDLPLVPAGGEAVQESSALITSTSVPSEVGYYLDHGGYSFPCEP
jgi:hypothetical protein